MDTHVYSAIASKHNTLGLHEALRFLTGSDVPSLCDIPSDVESLWEPVDITRYLSGKKK